MIQLSKNYSLPERAEEFIPIKIVSVGGAGLNALDRIVLDGLEGAEVLAINTDVQSLASSVAAHKVQLGRTVTRGLGAGGDPEVGYQAAFESTDEIREALTGGRMIFICTGLGGGTGSGAAPYVAHLARESGALVLAFATLPFAFEGRRRNAQAREALGRLNEIANAVVCFENDLMGDMVAPHAGIHQAFSKADTTISQSIRSIVNLIQRPGLIRIGFDDLVAALRSRNGRCLFGFGESDSENRAHDALAQALKSPLMDRGRTLADAARVLVQVAGGPGMTLSEVEIVMKELDRHVSDDTQILFGTAVDGRLGDRLSVTIISSFAATENVAPQPAQAPLPQSSTPPTPPAWEQSHDIASTVEAEREPEPIPVEDVQPPEPMPLEDPIPVEVENAPAPSVESVSTVFDVVDTPEPPVNTSRRKPASAKEEKVSAEKSTQAKQEVLQFEPVNRGRFEKSEPTIVEGEDLDVPTYLRKKMKMK
jgi:cell division protein FtsZ